MTTHKLNPFFPVTGARPQTMPGGSTRPQRGMIDRLADWAERQPQHRRLGGWTATLAASSMPRAAGR